MVPTARPLLLRRPGFPVATRLRTRWIVSWMTAVLVSICFEGVIRKYFPQIPQALLYFAKDVLLVVGLFSLGIKPRVVQDAVRNLRGFLPFLTIAVFWTLLEMFNPSQGSLALGFFGLKAYWLWWVAPLVVASALDDPEDLGRVIRTLAIIALVVGALAVLQFARPSDDPINMYVQQGDDPTPVAVVETTGRVRVASTFSFISGFTDFVTVIPPLLLAVRIKQPPLTQLLSPP